MKQLFVGGDLSGIQNFLYNISSKKAALSLRGRSFSLDDYMKKVYKELGKQLSSQNEIYNGGGKFYFITEDSQENRNKIKEFAKEQSKKIWQEHFGQLAINIAYIPFDYVENGEKQRVRLENGNEGNIGLLFNAISEKFKKQKQQKFKDLLIEDYNKFFEPISVPEKVQVCDVTGIETDNLVSVTKDDELKVLQSVKEQIDKGIELKTKECGYFNFSDYTKIGEKEATYLGVLRMDVDGLGGRFAKGFDNWEEYNAFSSELLEFFDRNNIQHFFDKDFVELIYSGGDDIFAVGRWDKVIDFAERLHGEVDKKFEKEDIHISGGMVIVNDKFPISKSAELSGEAESKAKQNEYNGLKKNSLTLFNETVSWKYEFESIKNHKEKLLNLIDKDEMPKSILHQIMYYYELSKQKENDYKYLWHSAYYITRFMDGKAQEIVDFCTTLRTELAEKKKLKLWAIASRWAELLLKDKDKKENNNQ